jgi:hypothetical protein
MTLRLFNRAFRALTDVPQVFNRYSLFVRFGLLDQSFGDHMVGIALKPGLFARELFQIEEMHGLKQGVMLFGCRHQFQEHRLFHTSSIPLVRMVVSRQADPTVLAPNKERLLPSRLQRAGFPQAEVL